MRFKTILCRWFSLHLRWSRHEGAYSRVATDEGETTSGSELRQCGLCGATIVRCHESKSIELIYDAEHQSTATDFFQRAQLLGFEGGQ